MLTSNQTLDMTPIGMIFHIVKTPAETHGQTDGMGASSKS